MGTDSKHTSDVSPPPTKSSASLLLGTIGDTTWRMFVPTIGLTLLGLYIDTQLVTKPWLTITGIILGTVMATVLVKQQLRNVTKS